MSHIGEGYIHVEDAESIHQLLAWIRVEDNTLHDGEVLLELELCLTCNKREIISYGEPPILSFYARADAQVISAAIAYQCIAYECPPQRGWRPGT